MKSRHTRLAASLLAVTALAAAGTASAQRGGWYEDRYGTDYDYARVLDVDPIVDVESRPVRRDECWEEPVVYRERSSRDRTPAIMGGIVGGVLGNQIGSGSGRDAATAAGALLGYSAVRDSQRRHDYTREYQGYEQRCATRTEYVRDERITGYDVTYRYRGRTYHTVTDYDPGDRIRIAVNHHPVR